MTKLPIYLYINFLQQDLTHFYTKRSFYSDLTPIRQDLARLSYKHHGEHHGCIIKSFITVLKKNRCRFPSLPSPMQWSQAAVYEIISECQSQSVSNLQE